jgi:quinolinate synthase
MLFQTPLDETYTRLPPADVLRRIADRKAELGKDLCILGHHYQSDDVFRFADFTGDSLKLSQQAASLTAKYIVFCGVHFMAESADVLTGGKRSVMLPDLAAGCTMAEMADADDVREALAMIHFAAPADRVLPITYVNSTAAVKAFTGAAGGACCTSSNACNVFAWALAPASAGGGRADKILAMPDQHLARNTALTLGYTPDDCVVFDPKMDNGGLSPERIQAAKFILWRGHCYVHQRFTVEQIERVRHDHPGIKVIVHPECPHEVVQAADLAGSTEQILRCVTDSPPGSAWAVGTEANMVHRLARSNPDKYVRILSDTAAMCVTMARIDPPHLLWVLDNLAQGRVVNRVTVAPDLAANARLALERMVAIKANPSPSTR